MDRKKNLDKYYQSYISHELSSFYHCFSENICTVLPFINIRCILKNLFAIEVLNLILREESVLFANNAKLIIKINANGQIPP